MIHNDGKVNLFVACLEHYFVFSVDLNTQLEDQKIIVHQHRQPSGDNQNVLTAEGAHWCDVFFTFKSDFTEFERKVHESFNTA